MHSFRNQRLSKIALPQSTYKKGQTDIPFHRVVYSNGTVWLSEGREEERLKLYDKEGIEVNTK